MRRAQHRRRHGLRSVSVFTKTTAVVASISTGGIGLLASTTPKPTFPKPPASAGVGAQALAAATRVGSAQSHGDRLSASRGVETARVVHHAASAPAVRYRSPSTPSITPRRTVRTVRTAPAVSAPKPAPYRAPVVSSGGS